MAKEKKAENNLDFENLKNQPQAELERIRLAKEIADSNKKKSSSLSTVIDKLAIPLLVAGIGLLLQYFYNKNLNKINLEYQKNISEVQTKNNAYLDSIQKVNQQRLDSSKEHQVSIDQRILEVQKTENQKTIQGLISALNLRNGLTLQDRAFLNEQKENRINDSTNRANNNRASNLNYISQQLSEFYWPIYYRLQKNNAVYRLMSNNFIGEKIDTSIILKNHLEILDILQTKFYLAKPDIELANAICD